MPIIEPRAKRYLKSRVSLSLVAVISSALITLGGTLVPNQNEAGATLTSNNNYWSSSDNGGFEVCANCAIDESVQTWSSSYPPPKLESVIQTRGIDCFLSTFGTFGEYTDSGWWYLDIQAQNLGDDSCSPSLSIGFTNGT